MEVVVFCGCSNLARTLLHRGHGRILIQIRGTRERGAGECRTKTMPRKGKVFRSHVQLQRKTVT